MSSSCSNLQRSNLVVGKFEDVVQFNGTPRELAGELGTHDHLVSVRLRVDHLQNVSVFLVRRLLPLADRVTTAIIPPLVVDSAVFGEAAGKRVRVLRRFGRRRSSAPSLGRKMEARDSVPSIRRQGDALLRPRTSDTQYHSKNAGAAAPPLG